jgi:hypothetical protein
LFFFHQPISDFPITPKQITLFFMPPLTFHHPILYHQLPFLPFQLFYHLF